MPPRQSIPTTTTQPPRPLPTGPSSAGQAEAPAGGVPTDISLEGLMEALRNGDIGLGGGVDAGSPFDSVLAQLGLDPTTQVFASRMRPRDDPYSPPFAGTGRVTNGGDWLPGTNEAASNSRPRTSPFGVPLPGSTSWRAGWEDDSGGTDAVDLLSSFYNFTRPRLLEVQRLLYAGGFFGDVDITDVEWGQHDENTFAAWATAVGRAARFFAVGEEITVDGVLRNAAQERLGGLGEDGGGGRGSGGDGSGNRYVQLSDPLALNDLIDRTSQSVLGRKATAGEQRTFVGILHTLQRDAQLAAQPVSSSGGGGGAGLDTDADGNFSQAELDAALAGSAEGNGEVTTIVQPDPGAQAEALLRQQNPSEAGAHDIDNSFRMFVESLRGVV